MKYLPLLAVTPLGHFLIKKTSWFCKTKEEKDATRVLWILTLTSILVDFLSSLFKSF